MHEHRYSRIAGEQGGEPERRIGPVLKSKVLGHRRVTLDVELNGFALFHIFVGLCFLYPMST